MSRFIIQGQRPLSGSIRVNGAKNAVLKVIPASLLSDDEITIANVPDIEDVARMLELVEDLGATVLHDRDKGEVRIAAFGVSSHELSRQIVPKIRTSSMFIGPMLARHGQVLMPHPGGCAIGKRPIDLFIQVFERMGATMTESADAYHFQAPQGLQGCTYTFPWVSVTVTEAMMTAAVLASGTTVIKNAALEPEISFLADYLNSQGARIQGAGTPTITVQGVDRIGAGRCVIMPDRIEAGSFAILGALTNHHIRVTDCRPDHLDCLFAHFDRMGVRYDIEDSSIVIWPRSDELRPMNLRTHEYPGFPTDLQPPFTVLLTQASGPSLVHETVFEGRLFFTDLLSRMGASITLCDPHRAIIHGSSKLAGRKVASPDLRAGIAMILAGLIAEGTTEIGNAYQIDRGYHDIVGRLRALGAEIERADQDD